MSAPNSWLSIDTVVSRDWRSSAYRRFRRTCGRSCEIRRSPHPRRDRGTRRSFSSAVRPVSANLVSSPSGRLEPRHRGAVVLAGSCVQLRTPRVPYAPIVEALRGLVRENGVDQVRRLLGAGHAAVARLLPELDPSGSEADIAPWGQGQLFEAMLELLGPAGIRRVGPAHCWKICTGRTSPRSTS